MPLICPISAGEVLTPIPAWAVSMAQGARWGRSVGTGVLGTAALGHHHGLRGAAAAASEVSAVTPLN